MRFIIAGPGAMGCLFAALLFRKHHDCLLLDHNRKRAALLSRQGIFYEKGPLREHLAIPISADVQSPAPVDVILCCVKSHDLPACLNSCRPLLNMQTLLVFLQNGIAHLDIQERMALPTRPVFAVSSEGATLLRPGQVLHAGQGRTDLGFLTTPDPTQQQQLTGLASALQDAGLDVSVSPDIRSRLWGKLFVNAGINPLTALYNRTNGQLLTSCAARGRLKSIVREAETVARACGVTITEDPVQATLAVCKGTAKNISSMLQDRRGKRPTEIEAINGAIVREGTRLGIPTPFNEEVVRQIREMEKDYRRNPASTDTL